MTRMHKCRCGGEPQVDKTYVCLSADRHGIEVVHIECRRCGIRTTGTSTNIDLAQQKEREKWNNFMRGHIMLDRREALRRSMEHWRYNYRLAKEGRLTANQLGASRCALCQLYLSNDCHECPLQEWGLRCSVYGSPYSKVYIAVRAGEDPTKPAKSLFHILRKLYREEILK